MQLLVTSYTTKSQQYENVELQLSQDYKNLKRTN
jgi:hypothetical protein